MVAMSLAIPIITNAATLGLLGGLVVMSPNRVKEQSFASMVWSTVGILVLLGLPWSVYAAYNSKVLQLLMFELDGTQRNSISNVLKYGVMEISKNAETVLADVGKSVTKNISTIAKSISA